MTKINPLITSLYSGSISKEEFIQEYFNGTMPTNEFVLDLIEKGISNKNAIDIEEAITLIYAGSFSKPFFVAKLCDLLLLPWHTKHEDIAMLFNELADPNTIDCLYEAAELKFDYLSYDDTYQFARKCIKALSAIDNEKAVNKLKILSNSEIRKVSEYAQKELRYKGIL